MKKNELLIGFAYTVCGIILALVGLLTSGRLESFLIAIGVGSFASGLLIVCKYYYWNRPKNKKRYEEKMANENIQIHDELLIKLRDKSGRYTTILGIFIICMSMVIFSILGQLDIINNSRIIVMFLGAYVLFQLIIYDLIFRYLLKKY